jgi:hypothetical protein
MAHVFYMHHVTSSTFMEVTVGWGRWIITAKKYKSDRKDTLRKM